MRVAYSPRYRMDIGAHVFPTIKYHRLASALAAHDEYVFVEPEPVPWADLALVHTEEYLGKVRAGTLTTAEIAQLELPWSPQVVDGFRLMTGGTVLAARHALETGTGVNLGGGFHHAFANHGEGFCLFNDVAVAIRVLQRDGAVSRAAVVDCDVHHGNGTALIFERDASVFTLSLHQQHNYPAFKPRSSLDIGFPDATQADDYLAALRQALAIVIAFRPQVLLYLAGADPYADDQLGGLALTLDDLRARDRAVFAECRGAKVPVVVTLAGGYARRVDDTVAIHQGTVAEAAAHASAG